MLMHKLELFCMSKNKMIGEMYVNLLTLLQDQRLMVQISMKEQVAKFLHSHFDKNKVTAIEKTSNLATLKVEDHIKKLQTNEVKLQVGGQRRKQSSQRREMLFA